MIVTQQSSLLFNVLLLPFLGFHLQWFSEDDALQRRLVRVFEVFQHAKWNKQLTYALLDHILLELFPDIFDAHSLPLTAAATTVSKRSPWLMPPSSHFFIRCCAVPSHLVFLLFFYQMIICISYPSPFRLSLVCLPHSPRLLFVIICLVIMIFKNVKDENIEYTTFYCIFILGPQSRIIGKISWYSSHYCCICCCCCIRYLTAWTWVRLR